jgi:hypothetical protein
MNPLKKPGSPPGAGRIAVGWREWVALPELGVAAIKAKMDTGARTSALHTFRITPGPAADLICFDVHPLQNRTASVVSCTARIVDQRWVSDSGGHRELRYIIRSALRMGGETWPIEISLTDRESMRFRLLIGRTAMHERLQVVPDASYLLRNGHRQAHDGGN